MMTAKRVFKDLKVFSLPEKAKFFPRFFKTGVGEYGEGDLFLGVTVPKCRAVAKKHSGLGFSEIENLLKSKFHEARLTALIILTNQFKKGSTNSKTRIYNFYLKNLKHINNWDLVDLSSDKIVGEYLFQNPNQTTTLKSGTLKGTDTLRQMAKSESLWERRISIISTFAFIKKGVFQPTIKISEILINDDHDLIHKAVGWMLREVGKKNRGVEERFLKTHYGQMPRTMLRYAIEKFPETIRLKYLYGEI